jgi:hypothetical protein
MLHHLDSFTPTTSHVGKMADSSCANIHVMSFHTMLWQIDMDAVEAHRALTKAHHSLEMNAIGVPFDPPRSLICETGKSDNARPTSPHHLPMVSKSIAPHTPLPVASLLHSHDRPFALFYFSWAPHVPAGGHALPRLCQAQ